MAAKPAINHFKSLEMEPAQVELLLSLPNDQAKAMVEKIYDRLMSASYASGTEHARAGAWETAKNILCDPVARQHHAEELGEHTIPSEPAPPRPQPAPRPRPRPAPEPGPDPEPWDRSGGYDEPGPWWTGGLLAMPAAILYMAGLTYGTTEPGSGLNGLAFLIAIITAWCIGMRWLKLLFLSPLLMGLGWMAAGITAETFARDLRSWNIAPEIGILAVLCTLGLGVGLAGQVRQAAEFTKGYLGLMTVCFFAAALVAIPTASLVVPTRTVPTGPGGPIEIDDPIERGPTARTEEELELTRNDWRQIQAGLRALDLYSGAIDGLVGPMTRASITAWQRTQSGVATSFVSRAHADALAALAPTNPPSPPPGGPEEPTEETTPTATNARLVIRAEPGSRIAMDDRDTGSTSDNGILTIDAVTPGGHVLRAEKDGFDTVTETIEVAEGISQVVELVARALPGRLTVTTNLRNAIVTIDGGEARMAPIEDIEVESGTRLVTVSSPGYNNDERYVDIPPDGAATHHAMLEETSLDTEIAVLRRMFDSRSYEDAAETADLLARMLVLWGNVGVDVDENLAVTRGFQGRSLYALERYTESVQPLYNAIRLGQRIELPIKHRHGGGGFRQGFCSGVLAYSRDEITFQSTDDPDHGFTVAPRDMREIERAEVQEGYLSRLNTEVEGRGSMDFVHPNSEQQRRDPDSALVTDIVCRDCNHALAVHEQLLLLLTRGTQ